ncbi:MAG TPA: peptidase, partial [Cyclobacteriaceae bacterium]|nr:peptidase [Cyclobacteriaceae bacterium]
YSLNDLKLLTAPAQYTGKLEGEGSNYVLNYKAQNSVLPALYWIKSQNSKAVFSILDTASTVEGIRDTLTAGSVIFKGITAEQAKKLNSQFGLDLQATNGNTNARKHDVNLPRVAIYHTWYNTQDEGWARFTFEQRGIPYTSIDKDELKAGGLRKKFDVILIPRLNGSTSSFINEIDKKFGPMPYTKTPEFPSHGTPDATNDMTGGPGFDGLQQLRVFVETGGVLLTIDNSTTFVVETGIARPLQSYTAAGLFHPGSIVQVKARNPKHPVLYGYPEMFHVFRGNGPLFQVEKYDRSMMLLQYGTKPLKDEIEYTGKILGMPDKKEVKAGAKKDDKPKETPYVLSGMVRNEQTIIGQGSIFNVPIGGGRVIAFTFDPLHRYLNHHDAPLVWNAIMNWDHLGRK